MKCPKGEVTRVEDMPNIIPVPVTVSVGIAADAGNRGPVRNFGAFRLLPYATTRGGSLEISSWLLMSSSGEPEDLDDVPLFTVLPRKLLWHVCQNTFEAELESVSVVLTIDDERWTYQMCARELEYEQVHYMIEIEGEWIKITEMSLSELVGEEHFVFCEREVLPSIDFADPSAIFEDMN